MNAFWFTSDVHACGMIRAEYVAQELLKAYNGLHISLSRNIMESDISQSDLMIFQRSQDMNAFAAMRSAQARGVKCIYEIDDDMLALPDGLGTLSEFFCKPEVRDAMRTLMKYADAIIVSTKELAGALQKYTDKNIYVVQNYINADAWELASAQRSVGVHKDKVVVGWTNSPAHVLDVPVITDVMKRVLDDAPDVEFLTVGCVDRKVLGEWALDKKYDERIKFLNWVHISALPEVMKNIDIGISPLSDSQFNRCRSNIKWQQYGVLGCPSVLSAGPVYGNVVDGQTGIIAKTADEWYAGIMKLVKDEKERREMGNRARLDVLAKWDLRRNFSAWMNVFKQVQSGK